MNTGTARPLVAFATLALSALALAGSPALRAQDIDPSNDPVWTPGGHYTAELDLGTAQLNLFPLSGDDQRMNLRQGCAPGREVAAGVYVLVSGDNGYTLQRTHPQGQPAALGSDAIALTSCEDVSAPRSSLRVPADVLSAFERAAVGAVYVH